MYQYNILNSCVACDELLDVIEKTRVGLFTSRQNIEDVKAETLEIVKNDDVLERYGKPLKNYLLRILGAKVVYKQRNETVDDNNTVNYSSLNRIKFQLIAPIRKLKTVYLGYLLKGLKEDIDTADHNRTERHLSMIISQCISQGWSTKGLFLLSSCFENKLSPEDKWKNFTIAITSTEKKKFEIYYSINMETRRGLPVDKVRETISSLGLTLRKGNEIINNSPGLGKLHSKLAPETTYINILIEAFDMHSAALLAINRLNQKISIATFYNTINPWIASAPQIVVLNTEDNSVESLSITEVFKTYDYIDGNNRTFRDTNKILDNPNKTEIKNRLHAAFSYTNLSRSSYFQETKYISLWIAIESVMRTGQFADIISHVKCMLPEILCTRYMYRIVRNFSEDCLRCGIKSDTGLHIRMDEPDKEQLIKELITIFRTPEQYAILESNCKVNELLAHRCKEIHEMLNDPNSIKQKFEHYTKKVRWHIQRLYRIRNEITHSAFSENRSLIIYIEHLYAYLAQLISEVVYYIEHKKAESVEEAFATIVENYRTFIELLRCGHLQPQDILPRGVIEFVE